MIAIRQKQRQNIRKEGIRNGTAKREKDRNQNFKETKRDGNHDKAGGGCRGERRHCGIRVVGGRV